MAVEPPQPGSLDSGLKRCILFCFALELRAHLGAQRIDERRCLRLLRVQAVDLRLRIRDSLLVLRALLLEIGLDGLDVLDGISLRIGDLREIEQLVDHIVERIDAHDSTDEPLLPFLYSLET